MTTGLEPTVKLEEPESGLKVFSIEVPEKALDPEIEKEYQRLGKKAKIPGFRQGKVPRSVLEKRFAGEIRSDALEKLISRLVWETLDEHKIVPFFDPEIDGLSVPEGGPITFRLSVEAWPPVELKKYQGFELRRTVEEVTDEEMEEQIQAIREAHVDYVPVDRGAIRGDQLLLSFQRFLPDGNAFGKRATDTELVIGKEESQGFQDTMERGLLGIEPGGIRSIPIDFPEDHPSKPLAGKKVEFRVEVSEVRESILAPLDDEFAARVAGGPMTLDELKGKVREELEARAREKAEEKLGQEIFDLLVSENPVNVPGRLVEKIIQANPPPFPPDEEIPPEQREEAAKRKAILIDQHKKVSLLAIQKLALLTEISKREGLEPKEQEIEAMRQGIRRHTDPSLSAEKKEEEEENMRREIRRLLREKKVLDWVKRNSTIS